MVGDWKFRSRNYEGEKESDLKVIDNHPLKVTGTGQQHSASKKSAATITSSSSVVLDPLSRMAQEASQFGVKAEFDPLTGGESSVAVASKPRSGSSNAAAEISKQFVKREPIFTIADEQWSSKRNGILNTYTTREKIAIRTAVLSAKDNIKEVVIQAEKLKPTDRVEQRLAELNDFDETSKTECVSVSIEEYLAKIADVNVNLTAAWRDEQRVKAVRLAIQCAKMLNDTSVIEFYPSKFVLITDILDNFGNLVFDRLRAKAEGLDNILPDNFTSAQVSNAAKETTLNWFYKLASIRELLPRIYMQTAILQSFRFISDKLVIF